MRIMTLMTGLSAATLMAGCGGSTPTSPSGNPTPTPVTGGGGGSSAAVTVGNILFRSGQNGTVNPAVDTIAVAGTVNWTWASNGSVPHSVQSVGSPSFTSSAVQSAGGSTYKRSE